MTGPDSQGRIFLTYLADLSEPYTYNSAGIYIFDTISKTVVNTIPLNYYVADLCQNPDESKLYICAYGWPALGESEYPDVFSESGPTEEHPDTGLVLEINLNSGTIENTVNIGTWPQKIHYADLEYGDKLLISTLQQNTHYGNIDDSSIINGNTYIMDIVDISSFSRAEPRIECPQLGGFKNCPWDNKLIIYYARGLNSVVSGPQEMFHAIWLIDPATNSVVYTVPVKDEINELIGVYNIQFNNNNENELYVCVGIVGHTRDETYDWLIVVDRTTGDYLRTIDIDMQGYSPVDILELTCGELIITANNPPDGKILVMEPENNQPVSIFNVITPMPYNGLSPAMIEFDASASFDRDPCDIITYEWDFDGDGIYSEPVDDAYTGDPDNPTHAYTVTYVGDVFLKVTDLQDEFSICNVFVEVFIE